MSIDYEEAEQFGTCVAFETLLGETVVRVSGAVVGSELIQLHCASNRTYSLFHEQDCCESCEVVDVVGTVDDLIGVPLLMVAADETQQEDDDESSTYTFYKLATVKGYVDIRWLGTSNGYYSETVDVRVQRSFIKVT